MKHSNENLVHVLNQLINNFEFSLNLWIGNDDRQKGMREALNSKMSLIKELKQIWERP